MQEQLIWLGNIGPFPTSEGFLYQKPLRSQPTKRLLSEQASFGDRSELFGPSYVHFNGLFFHGHRGLGHECMCSDTISSEVSSEDHQVWAISHSPFPRFCEVVYQSGLCYNSAWWSKLYIQEIEWSYRAENHMCYKPNGVLLFCTL